MILGERLLHRGSGALLHGREHVGVGIEGDGDGGVPKLLYV